MKGEHSRIKKIQSGCGGGGPDIFFLKSSMFFTEGRTGLPQETIGPSWDQLLLEGGPFQYF